MVEIAHAFETGITYAVMLLESIAAFVILWAAVLALVRYAREWHQARRHAGDVAAVSAHVRHGFGRSLLLALDFTIASDVLKIAIAPGFQEVTVVAIVVIIRVVLTFVLEHELRMTWRDQASE